MIRVLQPLYRAPTSIRASTSRVWRYAVVAVVAFSLGSATVVAARNPEVIGSLFYIPMLNGVATTPCNAGVAPGGQQSGNDETKKGLVTTTCTAVVDSKGQLSISDTDTHKSLNQLQFDAGGNLKTAGQGTATISGTVSVSNFPATQDVNITGGTVNATTPVATKRVFRQSNLGPKHTGHDGFNTINTSFIFITGGQAGGMFMTFSGPLGKVLVVGPIESKSFQQQSFTQRIPIDSIEYFCQSLIGDCSADVTVIGD